jgi:hypothetical protein
MLPEITMRWEKQAGATGPRGYVGSLKQPVASIGYGLYTRRDRPWVLLVNLPGYDQQRECASVEEGQAHAERCVRSFLAKALETPGGKQ